MSVRSVEEMAVVPAFSLRQLDPKQAKATQENQQGWKLVS